MHFCLAKEHQNCVKMLGISIKTRAVESESLKVGKSLKIGKIGFDLLLDFLAKMSKCHKMPKCLHCGSGSCIRIFYYIIVYLKGWGLSVKLGKYSAIWGKLGTALQAYALNPCTKFPQNPTSRKVNT